jgi:hypothetical protein
MDEERKKCAFCDHIRSKTKTGLPTNLVCVPQTKIYKGAFSTQILTHDCEGTETDMKNCPLHKCDNNCLKDGSKE